MEKLIEEVSGVVGDHVEMPTPILLTFQRRETFLANYWYKQGEGGLFVPGYTALQVGTPVTLEVVFTAPKMVFQVRGRVRWRRPSGNPALPAGIGVTFSEIDAQTHAVLLDFVTLESPQALTHRQQRLIAALRVKCFLNSGVLETRTENISSGGAFIIAQQQPAPGTLVGLEMQGERAQDRLDLDANVVWRLTQGPVVGFGVRFVLPTISLTRAVAGVVDHVGQTIARRRPPFL